MPSTAILFVPGAWHSPSCFSQVIDLLQSTTTYTTDAVDLPSVGPENHHYLRDLTEDVQQIRTQILRLAAAGHRVLVFAHSYGGVVASEAIQHLDWETRRKASLPGGVSHLFLCCSFLVPEGRSLRDALGGHDAPWVEVSADQTAATPRNPIEVFYQDVPEAAARAAVAALNPHSYRTFSSACCFAAWKVVPTTYLYCERDRAIPVEVQRRMVEGVGQGRDIRTETLDAGHSPFLSRVGKVVAAVCRAAEL
ncbi:alpha/beta fold hydrolase [Aspergillus fijiensis CBS 313.89]|uniref:Alpha/beta-hydrolase n=1 Tax=Aspergillus fijiensis CBS 313.89 TaxID=1448319 RepID=A0A8G1RQF3_9EURO|nr:alpha/beta-hydrolase [Aspergillus fijiensis CBS 313.89]RAK77555.1 alpha/beta-hydrolase [Aspergillus fijiensis CBS 313.89]